MDHPPLLSYMRFHNVNARIKRRFRSIKDNRDGRSAFTPVVIQQSSSSSLSNSPQYARNKLEYILNLTLHRRGDVPSASFKYILAVSKSPIRDANRINAVYACSINGTFNDDISRYIILA